jgi:hypothetical protein
VRMTLISSTFWASGWSPGWAFCGRSERSSEKNPTEKGREHQTSAGVVSFLVFIVCTPTTDKEHRDRRKTDISRGKTRWHGVNPHDFEKERVGSFPHHRNPRGDGTSPGPFFGGSPSEEETRKAHILCLLSRIFLWEDHCRVRISRS